MTNGACFMTEPFTPVSRIEIAKGVYVVHRCRSIADCRRLQSEIQGAAHLDAVDAAERWCIGAHVRVEGALTVDYGDGPVPWSGSEEELYTVVLPPDLVVDVAVQSSAGRWRRDDLGKFKTGRTPSPAQSTNATDAATPPE